MERKKASDFPPEVLGLFDGYVHGTLSRRDFLDRAAGYAAGGMGAAAMLASLSPNFAWAVEADARVNAGWPAWEETLRKNGIRYTMRMYPATQHGFHNDTTPRYDEAAAKLAWTRTLDFFELHLRG